MDNQKINKKAKKKGCEELLPWIQSVSNHLWWSAATCDESADILREKWLSLLYHITGKHRCKTSEDFQNVKVWTSFNKPKRPKVHKMA